MLFDEFRLQLHVASWFVILMAMAFILWFIIKQINIRADDVVKILLLEIAQLRRRDLGLGSLNIISLILIMVLGIIILAFEGVGVISHFVMRTFGEAPTTSLEGQIDTGLLFLAVVVFAALSVMAKVLSDR